ncbi:hypothetical protein PR048_006987 [Dryococelus australis]|uniref:C2H2-type domain-containing protein n=1 Tax=Dryococelus australis TaxID=614101 RepID=A0ABQ9ICF6_9NEOP|nr:hypothetical protein PR048_006987 [Dryococelus australis]
MKGRGKREIPEKTRRLTASPGTIPTCEHPLDNSSCIYVLFCICDVLGHSRDIGSYVIPIAASPSTSSSGSPTAAPSASRPKLTVSRLVPMHCDEVFANSSNVRRHEKHHCKMNPSFMAYRCEKCLCFFALKGQDIPKANFCLKEILCRWNDFWVVLSFGKRVLASSYDEWRSQGNKCGHHAAPLDASTVALCMCGRLRCVLHSPSSASQSLFNPLGRPALIRNPASFPPPRRFLARIAGLPRCLCIQNTPPPPHPTPRHTFAATSRNPHKHCARWPTPCTGTRVIATPLSRCDTASYPGSSHNQSNIWWVPKSRYAIVSSLTVLVSGQALYALGRVYYVKMGACISATAGLSGAMAAIVAVDTPRKNKWSRLKSIANQEKRRGPWKICATVAEDKIISFNWIRAGESWLVCNQGRAIRPWWWGTELSHPPDRCAPPLCNTGKSVRNDVLANYLGWDFALSSEVNKPPSEKVEYSVVQQGATVAERLACSPPTKAIRVQFPAGSLRILACENRAGRCRWSAGFIRDLLFPPPLHFGAAPYSPRSPSSSLKTSMLTAAQISPLPLRQQSTPLSSLHSRATLFILGCYRLFTVNSISLVGLNCGVNMVFVFVSADTSYSYHPAIHDDTFVRRKQRRNRTTFTLQQPMMVIEVSMKQCLNETVGEREIPRKPADQRHLGPVKHENAFSSRQQPMAIDKLLLGACSIEVYRVKAVQNKVSTFEIHLRKKSLLLPACILTGELSDVRLVKTPEQGRELLSSSGSRVGMTLHLTLIAKRCDPRLRGRRCVKSPGGCCRELKTHGKGQTSRLEQCKVAHVFVFSIAAHQAGPTLREGNTGDELLSQISILKMVETAVSSN